MLPFTWSSRSSRLEHSVSNAFLYYVINSSNQHHHSNVLRSWIPHLEQPIKQTRTFRVQCVSILCHEFKQPTPSFQCSAIVDPHLEPISRLEHCEPMRFYVGTVFPNLVRIFAVAMLTCVLTPVLGFVHATTQKCPRVHVLAGLPNCSFFRLLRDTRRANAR